MNTTSRMENASGLPSAACPHRDFVAVDESGEFSYHRSEQDLVAAFEYPAEAACIIDRSGGGYRLALDPDRHLVLGPARGPVEFHWLRQAWLDAQNDHPERHRLRRFFPPTQEEVIQDVFETLALEHGPEPAEGSWSLGVNGTAFYPANLADLDSWLARQDRMEHILVKDPFGHLYRPSRHRGYWYLPADAGFILYVEVPAPNVPR
ncbi:hypothetical protein ACFRAU_09565 [Arthrobacter sp. NPDC056691]|uniref:hypothetical protein n=1 Tax=Arthrobacter sp. NPDC056691 TaxID=3345913 RepID=UPI00366C21BB